MNRIKFEDWLKWKVSQKPKRLLTVINEDTMDMEYQQERDNDLSFSS